MTRTDFSHWTKLWRELAARGDPLPWHRRLIAAYEEKSRHYHNLRHLEECLAELERAGAQATFPARVAMALWFHDAVYDSHSASNEEDSARLAAECLESAAVDAATIETIRELILCTKTHEPGSTPDAA